MGWSSYRWYLSNRDAVRTKPARVSMEVFVILNDLTLRFRTSETQRAHDSCFHPLPLLRLAVDSPRTRTRTLPTLVTEEQRLSLWPAGLSNSGKWYIPSSFSDLWVSMYACSSSMLGCPMIQELLRERSSSMPRNAAFPCRGDLRFAYLLRLFVTGRSSNLCASPPFEHRHLSSRRTTRNTSVGAVETHQTGFLKNETSYTYANWDAGRSTFGWDAASLNMALGEGDTTETKAALDGIRSSSLLLFPGGAERGGSGEEEAKREAERTDGGRLGGGGGGTRYACHKREGEGERAAAKEEGKGQGKDEGDAAR